MTDNKTVCLTLEEIQAAHEDAKTEAAKTLPQLLAEEAAARAEYEANTTAYSVNEVRIIKGEATQRECPVSIADARRAFDAAIMSAGLTPFDWKEPFTAPAVPLAILITTVRAMEFFQGTRPEVTANTVRPGADATFTVKARGYIG